jgi:hypothetical protein
MKLDLIILTCLVCGIVAQFTARVTAYQNGDTLACGSPPSFFDTQNIVALNADGLYNGGRNCGRFLKATFGNLC